MKETVLLEISPDLTLAIPDGVIPRENIEKFKNSQDQFNQTVDMIVKSSSIDTSRIDKKSFTEGVKAAVALIKLIQG